MLGIFAVMIAGDGKDIPAITGIGSVKVLVEQLLLIGPIHIAPVLVLIYDVAQVIEKGGRDRALATTETVRLGDLSGHGRSYSRLRDRIAKVSRTAGHVERHQAAALDGGRLVGVDVFESKHQRPG